MKANNGTGNNASRDDWETPQDLWDKLNQQYNFHMDCCATVNNKKTYIFCQDFLEVQDMNDYSDWVCWLNPPFSKAKEMFTHFFKVVKKGVAIYRCDNMETELWQEIILKNASWIFVFDKKINYEGHKGNSARFGSALIGFNVDPPRNFKGILLKTSDNKNYTNN